MKLLQLQFKRFIRSPFLAALTGCTAGYLCLWARNFSYIGQNTPKSFHIAQELINMLAGFLGLCAFLLLGLFMLLSYELLRGSSDTRLEEAASSRRRVCHILSQLLLLLLLAIGLWLLICGLCHYSLWSHRALPLPGELHKNLLSATVLYALLPSLAGIALGTAWQGKIGKMGFYFFFTVVIFFAGHLAEDVYHTLGNILGSAVSPRLGIVVQKAMDFLYRIQPVYNNGVNCAYGIGIEPYRWAIILFWTIGSCGIYLVKEGRFLRKASGTILVVLAMVLGVFAWYRDHDPQEYLVTPFKRFAMSDATYYADKETEAQDADFVVETCRMNLSFFDCLSAEVRLTLEAKSLEAYTFTLHHSYEVKQITDGTGSLMRFSRDWDYVTVYNPSGSPITELCFSYSGHHQELYSNRQGIYLPGALSFYPMEGKRAITSNGLLSEECRILSPRYYDVEISFSLPVFTSLPHEEGTHFYGKARDLSIVGGMYRCEKQDGVRMLLPWAVEEEPVLQELSEELDKIEARSGLTFSRPQWNTVIYSPTISLPAGGTGICVISGDTLHIGTTYSGADRGQILYLACTESVSNASPGPVKDWYLQILKDVLSGDPTGLQSLRARFGDTDPETYEPPKNLSQKELDSLKTGCYLYSALKQGSLPELMKTIENWLLHSDLEDPIAFAKALWEGVNTHA